MIDSKAAVMMVSALAGAIAFWGAVYGWTKWLQRPRAETRADDHYSNARLQGIEHAVEAIALEVERLGEAQRYASRLQAEGDRALSPVIVPLNTPVRSITPH